MTPEPSPRGPTRRFVCGCPAPVRAALDEAFGAAFEVGVPADPGPEDLVVLGMGSAGAEGELPLGNAFSACRQLKSQPRLAVYLLLDATDSFGPEIARFCLADGCLQMDAEGVITDLEDVLRRWDKPRERASVDELLERLERELAGDQGRQASALLRMLDGDKDAGFVAGLTDRETGLFDGPFASFKLDEEFKRARRFHQPLSLVLLDCGVSSWPEDPLQRSTVLAEVASTFLTECRDIDVLARFTESVFLFLLPGTGTAGAAALARRIDGSLRERNYSAPIALDPAMGISTAPMAGVPDRRVFLARAEACLRLSMQGGGNETSRICVDRR